MCKPVEQWELFDNQGIYAENDTLVLRRVLDSDKENYLDMYRTQGLWQRAFAMPELNIAEQLWKDIHSPNDLFVIIVRKADGKFCGFCGLQKYLSAEKPELSIELVSDCQRQGIGYAALRLLMTYYTRITGQREFVSKVTYSNIPSQKLMRKLGGQPYGVALFPGLTEEVMKVLEADTTPLEEDILALAKEFGTDSQKIRSHVLVFRFVMTEP